MRNLRFILSALATLLSFTVSAQTHYESNITIGGKGGVTLSSASFSPTVPQSMLTGMIVGATFRYIEERHFGLIAEVNLEQRGWKEDFEEAPYSYSRTLTYIQIPFLTHIYFGSTKFHGFFNAGPEVAFMIGESTSANFDINNFQSLDDFPKVNRSTDQFAMPVKNKFDYGIAAGMGLEWSHPKMGHFLLEGRYYYGLGDIYGNSKRDFFGRSNLNNIVVKLTWLMDVKRSGRVKK